jgi:hypothetical protein
MCVLQRDIRLSNYRIAALTRLFRFGILFLVLAPKPMKVRNVCIHNLLLPIIKVGLEKPPRPSAWDRFAHDGHRVLLIDTDAQSHCATSFGLALTDGLYRFLIDREALSRVVTQPRSGLPLDLLPSDKSTEKIPYKLSRHGA